jgi:hypothetical protein
MTSTAIFFFRLAAVLSACFCAAILEPTTCAAAAPANFITRRGDQLFDGDRPFRFISFNIPNLMVIEDAYEFTRPNPWRWPDAFELTEALESVRQMGGQVVRTYVVSVYRDGSDMGEHVHVLAPGKFNDEGFRALDKLIEIAGRKRIRVIIPLVDQYKWWGGIGEYAAFRGKKADDFWTDRQLIDDYKATIRHVLTRKNSFTGIEYRNDPAIFGWETGNEIDSTPEWTREVSAYLKQLDPNHLVLDGKSLDGVPTWSLDDPNIDVITSHHYPWGTDHDYVKPIRAAHALTKGKKAYVVGEFGFVETPHITNAINTVIGDGISGALLWSLRMHRREGGFYWHMEVGTGRNIYKAYHWPGFASGDRYDEREIMLLMRAKAHEIRGLEPPPLKPPAPPKLSPIERASAISWQGSAGAESYDIWRREGANGDWKRIADAVSDAEVQYRPLFNDDQATPGREYYYRVAAKNAAGTSEPSNEVGPVTVECRTLVDECQDLSRTSATQGTITLATENARTVQEDCHRFELSPSSSVEYRVNGPVDQWRVYVFAANEDAELAFTISSDGKDYRPAMVRRQSFPSDETVYGYLTPILFEGEAPSSDIRYLRIARPNVVIADVADGSAASDDESLQVSRVEIDYDGVPNGEAETDAKRTMAGPPTPLNATVFVDNPRHIESTLAAIDKIAARGDRRVNVAVTILVDLTNDLRIKSYGWDHAGDRGYEPCDDRMEEKLRNALRQVFARIAAHNMDIYILPHIDSGGRVRTWRNWVHFDPLEAYGGYSYAGLMIESIATALADTVPPSTRVEMALSGEMGTSLFLYPNSYRQIIRSMRQNPRVERLKIGISLNHNGISGKGNPTGAPDIQLTDADRQQLQLLLDECNFIGMSCYRPVSYPPTTEDFVRGIDHFLSEFKQHGLAVSRTKPLHFSEVGIGGGHDDDDVAGDPERAVQTPWAGSGNPRTNPWRTPAMQQLRRQYHNALLKFLADQPASRPVTAAFFWSTGSWDPQGTRHPEFMDADIVDEIKRHNEHVAASERR